MIKEIIMLNKIKPIAIYLPQFHPTPENDEWWGKGFTEWTNVAKATPRFEGHHQPQLPSDLGFYDLRLEEARMAQEAMAKEYGIHGFCYYHYWFNGKRLLHEPLDRKLQNPKEDFPFMLCWANETWSRRWLGEEKDILIKQDYSNEDDYNHANYLSEVFEDERYIRIDGRPIFVIYRPTNLPNPSQTVSIIKETVLKNIGIEPFLIASNSHCNNSERLLSYGFDQILNFRPSLSALPFAFHDSFSYKRLKYNILNHHLFDGNLKVYSYTEALKLMQKREPETFEKIMPSVIVGWDNTARRKERGIIIKNNTPELFEKEINRLIGKMNSAKDNSGLLFINAWNEWAEGNHLEPCKKMGYAYLNIVKKYFK